MFKLIGLIAQDTVNINDIAKC